MRYYFPDEGTAWIFAQAMVDAGKTVIDYGFDKYRLIDQYYVEVED